MAGLNAKRRVFIEEYLRCWNATEAARRAGYKQPHSQGPRLLGNVEVQAAKDARIAERAMGADEVLHRLAEQARGDIGEILRDDGSIDLAGAKAAGKTRLLKSISDTNAGLRVEMYDAQAALQLLGRHHRLFNDNLTLNIDLTKLSDEQLERIANGEDPLAVVATPSQGGVGETPPQGATGESAA